MCGALCSTPLVAQVALPVVPIGVVKEYISSQLPLAEDLIEQKAREVFSEWLVAARKASQRIGRRAIATAWAHHLESETRWQRQLSAVRAVVSGSDPASSALGGFTLRPLEEPEGPSTSSSGALAPGDGSGNGGSASASSASTGDDVLDGFDLTPVYTASHVYETLGRGMGFWSYYCEERGKQLSIALAMRESGDAFMMHYQEYFSQVAGFFVVEDRVASTTGKIQHRQIAEAWDQHTSGPLAGVLAAQVRRIPTASEILVVRGFVQQLCAALNRIRLWTVPLEASMREAQGRYLELLVREGVSAAQSVVDKERYEPLIAQTKREYEARIAAHLL